MRRDRPLWLLDANIKPNACTANIVGTTLTPIQGYTQEDLNLHQLVSYLENIPIGTCTKLLQIAIQPDS